jgi:branched-chain amino acid transport system ATP-binding protein
MEALKVEHLSKSFGGIMALLDVSFSLDIGETLVIIGPNGAGKTTLINLLNGHLLPTPGGRILLFGKDITSMPPHYRARLGMARSFQLTTLFPGLTVLENILLALGNTKTFRIKMFHSMTTYKHWFAKAEEYLRAIDLWEKRGELVENIGYGEQRKLEILLCLCSKPKLLLLDEPSSGLTSAESADLIDKIYHFGANIPAIIVSHDMDLVFGVADRIIVLHHGRIIADGLPEEIKVDSSVKEIYMGIEGDTGIAAAR